MSRHAISNISSQLFYTIDSDCPFVVSSKVNTTEFLLPTYSDIFVSLFLNRFLTEKSVSAI